MLSGLWPIIINIPDGVTGYVLITRECGAASLDLCFLMPRNMLEQSYTAVYNSTIALTSRNH